MSAEGLPRWVRLTVILSPAIALIGLGLFRVEESGGSWNRLVPFVLVAAFFVAIMLLVYGVLDRSSIQTAQRQSPTTRRQFRRSLVALAIFPVTLLIGAVIALANHWWLAAGVLIAMVIPPILLRAFVIQVARRNLRGEQAKSEELNGTASDV